ncbi:MAG: hypothetical protein DMF64_04200 [Acidobacteria bacterium]|nr:MAG: hypothetical protein DMF64_04200 [Acidobacteriota bacterium]
MRQKLSFLALILRCARLRCPVCGRASIGQKPFRIRHHCPACNALFQREEGFFVGALSINVVTTELVVLIGYMFCQLVLGLRDEWLWPITFAVALLFPIAFYHHSWSLWLSLDHLLETLPQHVER